MEQPPFALILPAAGSGSRMGGGTPKPYRKIEGRTIIGHALSCFAALESLSQVVIVTSESTFDEARSLRELLPDPVDFCVVVGGLHRVDSIRNGLEAVDRKLPLIAVHDAVRPFVSSGTLRACLETAWQKGAAIPAVPVADTLKKVGAEGEILSTPSREGVWQAQTPQIFHAELLREAYARLEPGSRVTDDASVVELMGQSVHICEGERDNFKITWPADFRLAELMVKGGWVAGGRE